MTQHQWNLAGCGSSSAHCHVLFSRDGDFMSFRWAARTNQGLNMWIFFISANGWAHGGSKLIQLIRSQVGPVHLWKLMNIGAVWPQHVKDQSYRIQNDFAGSVGPFPYIAGWWLDWIALLDVLCTCFIPKSRNTVAGNSRKPIECRGSDSTTCSTALSGSVTVTHSFQVVSNVSSLMLKYVQVLFVSLT